MGEKDSRKMRPSGHTHSGLRLHLLLSACERERLRCTQVLLRCCAPVGVVRLELHVRVVEPTKVAAGRGCAAQPQQAASAPTHALGLRVASALFCVRLRRTVCDVIQFILQVVVVVR